MSELLVHLVTHYLQLNHIKLNQSTGDQLFHINMLTVAKTKKINGNHKIAVQQVNSYV